MADLTWSQAVAANQQAVLDMETGELRAVLSVLNEVQSQTATALSKIFSGKLADLNYTAAKHATVLQMLKPAISTATKRLGPAVAADLKTGVKTSGASALKHTRAMAEAGIKKFRGISTSLKLPEASILLSVNKTVFSRHAKSAKKYSGDVGRAIQRDMAIGLVRGESTEQTAKRLLGSAAKYDKLAKKSNGSTLMADDIAEKQYFRSKAEAVRLVRTERVGARSLVQIDALRALNDDEADVEIDSDDDTVTPGQAKNKKSLDSGRWLKMWDAFHDHRTCLRCRAVDGEVRELTENFSCGVPHPPLHPHDRCTITPWHSSWGAP